eukprot:9990128-Heterocapsa_arctica.AAC.1
MDTIFIATQCGRRPSERTIEYSAGDSNVDGNNRIFSPGISRRVATIFALPHLARIIEPFELN